MLAPPLGHVDAVDLGGEVGAEAAAVAGVVGLGGVPDEVDSDGGTWPALRGGRLVEGALGVALSPCGSSGRQG